MRQPVPRAIARAFDDVVKILTLHARHRNELEAVYFAQIVNPQNVLMRDLAGQQQFLFESLHRAQVPGHFGTDQLERYHAAHLQVPGAVDLAHPPSPIRDSIRYRVPKLEPGQHRRRDVRKGARRARGGAEPDVPGDSAGFGGVIDQNSLGSLGDRGSGRTGHTEPPQRDSRFCTLGSA